MEEIHRRKEIYEADSLANLSDCTYGVYSLGMWKSIEELVDGVGVIPSVVRLLDGILSVLSAEPMLFHR